ETQPMTQAGFGMPLILATHAAVPYAEYTNIADVAEDYPETTAAYKIAARVLGQSPRPSRIAMVGIEYDDGGNGGNGDDGGNGGNGDDGGNGGNGDDGGNGGNGDDGGNGGNGDDGGNGGNGDDGGNGGNGDNGDDNPTTLTTTLTSALNDLVQTHNDWYFLLCDQQSDAVITELSGWIDTQKKLYFASTDNLNLAASLKSENTVIMYHDDPTQYPAEGWVGRCAPELPGSITWKFKTKIGRA